MTKIKEYKKRKITKFGKNDFFFSFFSKIFIEVIFVILFLGTEGDVPIPIINWKHIVKIEKNKRTLQIYW
jgi:hypothetical protein